MKKDTQKHDKFENKFTGEVLTLYPSSFLLWREAFGLPKEITRSQVAEQRRQKKAESFKDKHKCPYCGTERHHIKDTNIMVCVNEKCKGFNKIDEAGETVQHKDSYELLTTVGSAVAKNLLD